MKRFYQQVSVEEVATSWQVMLDGRAVRTQGTRRLQAVPTRALADLLAQEWRDQGETIDPKAFVYRDLADYALDVISPDMASAIAGLLAYAETDTLCYRADPETPLYRRQQKVWEPLVAACETRHAIQLPRVSGIVHRPLKPDSAARLQEALTALDLFTLAGLQTMTALAASLVTGLAALDRNADIPALFAAANAEEDWQAEQWGWDADAQATRAARLAAFEKAGEFVRAARPA